MTRHGLWGAVLGFAIVAADAQPPEWFRDNHHDKVNRWEGLVGENQSSVAWELRSFLGTMEPYPDGHSVNLTVTYYVPDASEAFLVGQLIRRSVEYRMLPKPKYLSRTPGWRNFGPWQTGAVLLPFHIRSNGLGVLIRIGGDSNAVNRLAPAIVHHSPEGRRIEKYLLDIFIERAIAPFQFELAGAGGYTWRSPRQPGADSRSTVRIEFDAVSIPEGQVIVRMNPRFEESPSERLALEMEFYHKLLTEKVQR